MSAVHLDHRLSAIAQRVRPQAYFADIGTDHGYLPAHLALQRKVRAAIAADVNEKPLAQAEKTIAVHGLQRIVTICLSNGLQRIDPAVDSIAIAGMGGELIASILAAADWVKNPDKQFLLQPMTQDEHLRRWLTQAGFSLLEEQIAQEGRHLYTIIEARYTDIPQQLSPALSYAGLALLQSDPLSRKYVEWKKGKLKKIAAGLEKAGKAEETAKIISLISQLEEYK